MDPFSELIKEMSALGERQRSVEDRIDSVESRVKTCSTEIQNTVSKIEDGFNEKLTRMENTVKKLELVEAKREGAEEEKSKKGTGEFFRDYSGTIRFTVIATIIIAVVTHYAVTGEWKGDLIHDAIGKP